MMHVIVTKGASPRLRLNIVSGADDAQLSALREHLQGEHLASTRADVGGVLDSLDDTLKADTLDLIGHSARERETSDRYLEIGSWLVDKTKFTSGTFARWHPSLTRMGIHTVRLLGCATATTPGGRECIQEIKRRLGKDFRVFGTRRMLSLGDYSADGFESEDALVEAAKVRSLPLHGVAEGTQAKASASMAPPRVSGDLPDEAIVPVQLGTHLLEPETFESLPAVPWRRLVPEDATARALWKLIDPKRAWSIPSLLTRPDLEILFPARERRVYRAEVLMGELIRVRGRWPYDDQGLIYPIKDPAAFQALLS